LFFTKTRAQQDAQFSQYIFNGLYINPAYAGYKGDFYANSFYRSQWTGLDGAPTTMSVTADGAVDDDKVGLGLLIAQDKVGAQSMTSAYANYAYRLQLAGENDSRLAFGLGFGFIQNSINGAELTAVQSGDSYVPGGQSLILPDARFGVLYTSANLFAGVSVDNLLAPYLHTSANNALTPIPKPNGYFTTGALFNLGGAFKYKPSILIKETPGEPVSMDFNNFILLNDKIWIGGTYRTTLSMFNGRNVQNVQSASAAVVMVEFYITDGLRIGYAYDYSLGQLGNYGYGSHEVSISIVLKRKTDYHTTSYF
jgi:type IX secretion system PorP/SprF family membrane protein